MLGDAGNAAFFVPLHPLNVPDAHLAHQVGILPEGFVGTSPSGIPGDVDNRTHGRGDAHGPALLANNSAHLGGQLRFPGGGQVGHRGEQRAAGARVAAEVFALEDHRNAQPGFLDEIPLNSVGQPGDFQRGGKAHGGKLGKPAVSVGVSLPHDLAGHAAFHQQGRQVAAELGGFFFQGHAGEQVLHPEGDGLSFVLIEHGITSL